MFPVLTSFYYVCKYTNKIGYKQQCAKKLLEEINEKVCACNKNNVLLQKLNSTEMKKSIISLVVLSCSVMSGYAQDATLSQMQAEARTADRIPKGDRSHYGLWAKDFINNWNKPKVKSHFASSEDSISKHKDFVMYYSMAYYAYRDSDYAHMVEYGDSALKTGFDTPELWFYLANSLEQLGNYERALTAYQEAKDKGFSAGGKALSEFKKRLKKIQKKKKK